MNVAITGATGFIGRKLLELLLNRGDNVRLLSRSPSLVKLPNVESVFCDLRTASQSELTQALESAEVIYHCAGQLTNTAQMHDLHVTATQKLANAAAGKVKHWVQLSSVGVYGPHSEGLVTENSPLNPIGPYETTKTESDKIVETMTKSGAFTHTILRPSNVFGADMKNQSLFRMISMIDRGLFFFVGKKGASANYIHVNNVANALVLCGTNPAAKGMTYNLSDNCTMEHFVDVVSEELGKKIPTLRIPKFAAKLAATTAGKIPGFPLTEGRVNALSNFSKYPTDLIEKDLGYRHSIGMDEAIRELTRAYKTKKSEK